MAQDQANQDARLAMLKAIHKRQAQKLCSRCEKDWADETVKHVTGKEVCITCCIRGYKYVIGKLASEKEELERELRKLKGGKK